MIARSKFIFREFKYRKSGAFNDKGKDVQFSEAYILKCDDVTEDGEVFDLEFTIPVEETELINILKGYKYMDEIVLDLYIYMIKSKKGTAYIKLKDVVIPNTNNTNEVEDSGHSPKQTKLFN